MESFLGCSPLPRSVSALKCLDVILSPQLRESERESGRGGGGRVDAGFFGIVGG